MKNKIINAALWLSYILAMVASLGHVAATFNRFEWSNTQYVGWIAAVSVDAGLAALAYAIQQRRRARRSVRPFWFGLIIFASISAYANVLHALSVSPKTLFSAIAFSATLPGLVIFMGEIVSSDDANAAEALEREQRRIERNLANAQTQIGAALLPALTQASDTATQSVFACDKCDATFANRFALSAHARAHKNGHSIEATQESEARE